MCFCTRWIPFFYLYITFPLWKVFRFWVFSISFTEIRFHFPLFFFCAATSLFHSLELVHASVVSATLLFQLGSLRSCFFFTHRHFSLSAISKTVIGSMKETGYFFSSYFGLAFATRQCCYFGVEIIKQYLRFEIWAHGVFVSFNLLSFIFHSRYFILGASCSQPPFPSQPTPNSLSVFVSIVVSFLVSVFEPQIDAQMIVSMIANEHSTKQFQWTKIGKWGKREKLLGISFVDCGPLNWYVLYRPFFRTIILMRVHLCVWWCQTLVYQWFHIMLRIVIFLFHSSTLSLSLFFKTSVNDNKSTDKIGKIERITRAMEEDRVSRRTKSVTIVQTNLCAECTLYSNIFFVVLAAIDFLFKPYLLSVYHFEASFVCWMFGFSIKPQKANSWIRAKQFFFGST